MQKKKRSYFIMENENTGNKELLQTIQQMLKTELTDVKIDMFQMLKTEINGLRTELKDEIQGVRTELTGEIQGVKTELTGVKADVKDIKKRLATVENDVVKIKNEVTKTNLTIENDMRPTLNLLAEAHKSHVEKMKNLPEDIEDMKEKLSFINFQQIVMAKDLYK